MPCYATFWSHLNDGVATWGTALKKYEKNINEKKYYNNHVLYSQI